MLYAQLFRNGDGTERGDARERFATLVDDFVAGSSPGGVVVGIADEFGSFEAIDARIRIAQQHNAWGTILFSYYNIDRGNYWQALRDGPYKELAVPSWP